MEEILAELDFVEDPAAVAAVRESMSDALANNHIDMTPSSTRGATQRSDG